MQVNAEAQHIVLEIQNFMCPIKSMKKVRKHINIKLVTTEGTRNYLVSEPNHHTTKFLTENLLPTYKPVYLR